MLLSLLRISIFLYNLGCFLVFKSFCLMVQLVAVSHHLLKKAVSTASGFVSMPGYVVIWSRFVLTVLQWRRVVIERIARGLHG